MSVVAREGKQRGHRVVSRRWILFGLLGVAVGYLLICFVQVWWASKHYDKVDSADAIVVLGAAQWDGEPSPVFEGRLNQAFRLYDAGVATHLVTTGSNQPGDRFTEGFAGYEFLREQGVPDENILVITDGSDTYEQLTATKAVLDDRGLSSVVLVSDPYHNYRALQMAKEIGIPASANSTDLEPQFANLARETGATALGHLLGWRRVSNLR